MPFVTTSMLCLYAYTERVLMHHNSLQAQYMIFDAPVKTWNVLQARAAPP